MKTIAARASSLVTEIAHHITPKQPVLDFSDQTDCKGFPKNMDLQEALVTIQEGDHDELLTLLQGLTSKCQYETYGNIFKAVSRTTPKLPAGYYYLDTDSNGALNFKKHVLKTDKIITLPDSPIQEVLDELTTFWTLKDLFEKYGGNTFKRGCLLWGPPGSGKTLLVAKLIEYMIEFDGVVFNCSAHPNIVKNAIQDFRAVEPTRPLMNIFEDVDAIVNEYREEEVLAILDGDASTDYAINIATTNYPEKLDQRLLNRPSRFDVVVFIDVPCAASRKVYLQSRNLPLTDDEINHWVKDTEGFSIAHLKELIISVFCYQREYKKTLERLKKMARKVSSETKKSIGFMNEEM